MAKQPQKTRRTFSQYIFAGIAVLVILTMILGAISR